MTPGLAPNERRALDLELLTRLRTHGRPATLADIFEGLCPRWAQDAADRLQAAGMLTEDAGGKITLTTTRGK